RFGVRANRRRDVCSAIRAGEWPRRERPPAAAASTARRARIGRRTLDLVRAADNRRKSRSQDDCELGASARRQSIGAERVLPAGPRFGAPRARLRAPDAGHLPIERTMAAGGPAGLRGYAHAPETDGGRRTPAPPGTHAGDAGVPRATAVDSPGQPRVDRAASAVVRSRR